MLAGCDPKPWFAGIEFGNPLGFLRRVEGVPVLRVPDIAVASVQQDAVSLTDGLDSLTLDHFPDIVVGDDSRVVPVHLFAYWKRATTQGHRV